MDVKTKALVGFIALLVAFGFGRYSVPVTPSVHTVVDTKIDKDVDVDKDVHKVTKIVKEPTGVETTTITEDTVSKIKEDTDTVSHFDQTVIAAKRSTLNVSALAGVDATSGLRPVYGASVSKELLGPVTVGIFGLTNGMLGVSLGINF